MRILVTGHEGFIGKNMLAWLNQEDGWHIDGYEWHPTERPDVSGYDWVIHLGAIADMTCMDVEAVLRQNLEFSQWLFNECNYHGVNLQYASSSSVYGDSKDFTETASCYPQTQIGVPNNFIALSRKYDWSISHSPRNAIGRCGNISIGALADGNPKRTVPINAVSRTRQN